MKRLILMIAVAICMVTGIQAQNANRSGFFVELEGGRAFGNVVGYEIEYQNHSNYNDILNYEGTYIKNGAVGGIHFGYRKTTSNSVAVELKIGASTNFLDVAKLTSVEVLPGVRWTSKEFSGNKSLFISFNAGVGFITGNYNMFEEPYVPTELGIGINFSNNFYAGFFVEERINTKKVSVNKFSVPTIKDYYINWEEFPYKTHTSAGLRLGFRF